MAFIFLNLLVMLVFLQAGFLFGGDSAEYSTALSTFSIPHPPGYPLYSLIGNAIVRLIPLSTNTWRMSFLSSVPTAMTGFLIYLILNSVTKKKFIPLISAVLYIFLFPVWLYAEVPEVFALNNLFIAFITYSIIKYNQTKKNRYAYLIFLFVGLSVSHHHTFILFIPGWLLLITSKIRKKLFINQWRKKIIILLTGVSFYLYPLLVSRFDPPIDWENSRDIMGLLRLFFRTSYGTFNAYSGVSPNIQNQLYDFLSLFIFLLHDFKLLGLIVLFFGLLYLIKTKNSFSRFILINLLVHAFFIFYTNFSLNSSLVIATFERYLILVYFNLIFILAYGFIFLEYFLKRILNKTVQNNNLIRFAKYGFNIFLVIYVLIVFFKNLPIISQIKSFQGFEHFADNILKSLPSNSLLFVHGDVPYFTVQYWQSVAKVRKDVKVIFLYLLTRDYYAKKIKNRFPEIYIPAITYSKSLFFKDFLENNGKKMNIFFETPGSFGYWQPYGLLWKYYPTTQAAKNDSENIISINEKLWAEFNVPDLNHYQKELLFVVHLKELYSRSLLAYLNFLVTINQIQRIDYFTNKFRNIFTDDDVADLNARIWITRKDCSNLFSYKKNLRYKNIFELSYFQLETIIKYYGLCDPQNKEVYPYLKTYGKFDSLE